MTGTLGIIFFFFKYQGVLGLYQAEVGKGASVPALSKGDVQFDGASCLPRAPHQEGQGACSGLVCGPLWQWESFSPSTRPEQEGYS